MRKSTKRLGTLKRNTRRAGRPSSTNTRNAKQMTPMQKARAAKKELAAKLKMLKTEFKQKLQAASETAYENAMRDFQRDYVKKLEAKQKVLAAAEAKFEKKFAKKASKKTKSKRRKTATSNTATAHHTMSNRQSRRGRPRKAA